MTRNVFWNKFVAKSGIMYRIECWGGADKKAEPIDESNHYNISWNYIECPPTLFTIKTIVDNEHEYRLGLPDNYTADIEVCFSHASSYLKRAELYELQKLVWKPKYSKNGWFITSMFTITGNENVPVGEPAVLSHPRIECGTCWRIYEYSNTGAAPEPFMIFQGVQIAGLEGEISTASRITIVAEQIMLHAMKGIDVYSVFDMVAFYGRLNAGRGEADLPVIKRPQYFFRYYGDVAIMASIVGQMIEGLDPNDGDFFDKKNKINLVQDGGFTFASLYFCLETLGNWLYQLEFMLTDGRAGGTYAPSGGRGLTSIFSNDYKHLIKFYKQTYTQNYAQGELIPPTNSYGRGLWINISTEGAVNYDKNHTPIYQHNLNNHEHDLYKVGGYSNAYDFINGLLCSQLLFASILHVWGAESYIQLDCFIKEDSNYDKEIEADIIGGAVKNKIEVNTEYLVNYNCNNIEFTDYDVRFKDVDNKNKDNGTLAITNVFNNQFPNCDWYMEYYNKDAWKQLWHELRSEWEWDGVMQPEKKHTDRFGRNEAATTIALHYRPFAETPGLLLFYMDKPLTFDYEQFFMVYPYSKKMEIEEWVAPEELKKTYLWIEGGQTKARWLKAFQTLIKRVQDTGCLHNHVLEILTEKLKPANDKQVFMLELTFNINDFYTRFNLSGGANLFGIKYNITVESESNPDCLLFELLELGASTAWQPQAITQDFDASTITIKLMGIG